MRAHPLGEEAEIVGTVRELPAGGAGQGLVAMRTVLGTTRVVDMLAADQLPRIC
jgi:hydrogenase expression/formation protein HypE